MANHYEMFPAVVTRVEQLTFNQTVYVQTSRWAELSSI